jgi:multiple sugar transport system substrate-binding protein
MKTSGTTRRILCRLSRLCFRLTVLLCIVILVQPSGLRLAAAQSEPSETVTLSLGSWDDENGSKRHIAAIADFEKQYPNIKVNLQQFIGSDWQTQILGQILTGNLPDVYMVDSSSIPIYVESGGLSDLRPFIEGPDGLDPDKLFYPSVYKNGFYKGTPYALAKDYSTVAIYANRSMFEAAGIKLPQEGWTYDDLLKIAQRLTLDSNGHDATNAAFNPDNVVRWGLTHLGSWWRGYQTVIYSFGTHTISDDGLTLDGFLNNAPTIAALQWMQATIHRYHAAPTIDWVKQQAVDPIKLFLDGKVAMIFAIGPWYLSSLEEKPDFKYAILPMPTGPGGHHSAVAWAGFGMAPNTKHPQEAWLLLRALGTDIGQRYYSEHALSPMPSMMHEKLDHPFWSTFLKEVNYLDSLDDLKNPYYLQCVGVPAGDQINSVLFADGGAKIDIKQLVNKVLPTMQDCLDQSGQIPLTPTPKP